MTKVAIYDIETNGLLHKTPTTPAMDRVHVLCMLIPGAVGAEPERLSFWRHDGYIGPAPANWVARHFPHLVNEGETWDAKTEWNIDLPPQDNIEEGLKILQQCDVLTGHNVISFDEKAIKRVYPSYKHAAKIEDTLVMARLARPDTKQSDSALAARGKMPGYLVGSHSLDAWGHRLGKFKGEYMKEMIAKGLAPWEKFNPFMAEYCENDVEVSYVLWAALKGEKLTEMSQELEHGVHELLDFMESSGIFFDKPAAEKLEQTLRETKDTLTAQVIAKYGRWIAPEKKRVVKKQWENAKPVEGKKFHEVRPEYGEDMSRAVWGEVSFRKLDRVEHVKYDDQVFRCDRFAGAPYCKAVWKEFNPGSRTHIIDRFTTVHDWIPVDFTEKGNPELSDTVLQQVKTRIPEAAPMAEIFLHSKLLGQLADGKKSWLNKVDPDDGRIHPYVNCNGAVSGRCTHSDPNIGQVPAVMVEDVKRKDGTLNPKILGPDGEPFPYVFNDDGSLKKKAGLRGRAGEYGFECRSLFYTPEMIDQVDWIQIGVDLSGIEMRMLGEVCAEFDGGEMLESILHGDVHQRNMELTGLTSRDIIKRGSYGLMYGAGDEKLGVTVAPDAHPSQYRQLGAAFRAAMMTGLPALKKAIDKCKNEVNARGYLIGLDGRRLYSRSAHSALNLRLQSNGALIAKKWTLLTEEYALDSGMNHGWGADFAMLLFIHDETQSAARKELSRKYADLCIQAAADAGKFFGITCPIGAEAKFGKNWMECH